jgi:hypothetical protein
VANAIVTRFYDMSTLSRLLTLPSLLLAVSLVLLASCATNAPSVNSPTLIPAPAPLFAPPLSQVPAFSHVYVLMLENQEYNNIVDNANLPYLNGLISRYGLATNYHGLTHPSQPNYLALFSGSTQDVTDDDAHQLDAMNLADQLDARGKTWRIYEQNVRPDCYTGDTSDTHAEGPGRYMRTHNPAISFNSVSGSPTRCKNITGFTAFDPAAADFELIVPDSCNDMHDCAPATSDQFLASFVPKILNSTAWQQGGVLFLAWDEGTTNEGGGGHVPLIVISSLVARGFQSSVQHDHYSILRTVEDAWGLPCLGLACQATNLADFFP